MVSAAAAGCEVRGDENMHRRTLWSEWQPVPPPPCSPRGTTGEMLEGIVSSTGLHAAVLMLSDLNIHPPLRIRIYL